MPPRVTVGIINYNGMETLPACLEAVSRLQCPGACEVMVVDNCSSDGSREWLARRQPHLRLLCLPENIGVAGARNAILSAAEAEYVLLLDNDIVLGTNALVHLLQAMETVDRAAVCHPEICDPQDPAVHRYNGGWIHFLCGLIPRPRPERGGSRPDFEVFDTVSGAALLIHRARALEIGGFDQDYFFNWEDGDFAVRCTLAGYLCLNVPAAIALHRGKPRGRSKAFYQVRNRWYFILKLYSWRTLFWTGPALLAFELSQAVYLCASGAARDYWQGNWAVLTALPRLLRKRKKCQKLKTRRDRDWLTAGELFVPSQICAGDRFSLLLLFSKGVAAYWRCVRHFC